MAYIPANAELASVPGIRWVGAIKVTDKLSDYLQTSLDKGFVLVRRDTGEKKSVDFISGVENIKNCKGKLLSVF